MVRIGTCVRDVVGGEQLGLGLVLGPEPARLEPEPGLELALAPAQRRLGVLAFPLKKMGSYVPNRDGLGP